MCNLINTHTHGHAQESFFSFCLFLYNLQKQSNKPSDKKKAETKNRVIDVADFWCRGIFLL